MNSLNSKHSTEPSNNTKDEFVDIALDDSPAASQPSASSNHPSPERLMNYAIPATYKPGEKTKDKKFDMTFWATLTSCFCWRD